MGSTLIKNVRAVHFNTFEYGNPTKHYVIIADMADKNCRPLDYKTQIVGHGASENLYAIRLMLTVSQCEGGIIQNTQGNSYMPEKYLSDCRKAIAKSVPITFFDAKIRHWSKEGMNEITVDMGIFLSLFKSAKVDYDGNCDAPYVLRYPLPTDATNRAVTLLNILSEINDGNVLLPPSHYLNIEVQ